MRITGPLTLIQIVILLKEEIGITRTPQYQGLKMTTDYWENYRFFEGVKRVCFIPFVSIIFLKENYINKWPFPWVEKNTVGSVKVKFPGRGVKRTFGDEFEFRCQSLYGRSYQVSWLPLIMISRSSSQGM